MRKGAAPDEIQREVVARWAGNKMGSFYGPRVAVTSSAKITFSPTTILSKRFVFRRLFSCSFNWLWNPRSGLIAGEEIVCLTTLGGTIGDTPRSKAQMGKILVEDLLVAGVVGIGACCFEFLLGFSAVEEFDDGLHGPA